MEINPSLIEADAPGVGRTDDLDRILANASRMFMPVVPQASGKVQPAAAGWSPQDGWNLKLGQSAQNVLRHQLISAPRDVVDNLRAELAADYGRAHEQKVQLSPVVESLVRVAMGGEDADGAQQSEQEQAAGGAGNAGSAGSAGGGGGPASLGGNGNGNVSFNGGQSGSSGNSLAPDDNSSPADMQGWGQGAEGNCAAVATIKAATDAYGDQVFQQMTQLPDGGYRITMQDGVTVEVSGQELQLARQQSNFTGGGPGQEFAQVAYAAMAKRALMEGHEGASNYGQALNSLANGDNPYDSARFLGLGNRVVPVNASTLSGQDSVVAWNGNHAVFVDNARASDSYGTARRFDGTDTRGHALTSAFTFAPMSGAVSTPAAGRPRRTVSAPAAGARNIYHRHFSQNMSSEKKSK